MKAFIFAILWSISLHGQTSFSLTGEWTSGASVNKKMSPKNCATKDKMIYTFKSDGTYSYRYSYNAPNVISKGKYTFDNSSKVLTLFDHYLYPDKIKLLKVSYKVLSLDNKALKLNLCFCKVDEGEDSSDKCETTFSRTK